MSDDSLQHAATRPWPLRKFERRVLYPLSVATVGLAVYYAVKGFWWMAAFMVLVDLFLVRVRR